MNELILHLKLDVSVKSIYWHKLDGPLSANVNAHAGLLRINKVQDYDFGIYECVVLTHANKLIRKSIRVSPKRMKNAKTTTARINIHSNVKEITKGGKLELECKTGMLKNFRFIKI
jgi:hypothetical protein